ncbi:MAG: T9SS type A sorting domain-containing protein, partial [Bacteroidetes bacterium]|nr:T9SS type A sorting domain-containing protein [Bacteroidota bacterium]
TGYAVSSKIVLKSVDAGNTWTRVSPPNFPFSVVEDCYFTDVNTGYIGSWYGPPILKTTDGGINWFPVAIFEMIEIYGIDFIDKNRGYSVGNGIFKTIDAGNNWIIEDIDSSVSNIKFYSVNFNDTSTGYVVGENGTILKTDNGGSVGISEIALENKQVAVSIYPNPNNNEVIIKMNIAKNQNVEIRLLSLSGQVLYEEKPGQLIGAYQKKIDLQGYAKGIYYLQIITDTEVINRKIVFE